jgi:hypothetical protein
VDAQERTFRAEIDRLLDVSLFALVVTGFVALAGTAKLDIFSVAAVTLAILGRGYLFFRRSDRQLSVASTTKLTIAYVFVYAADYLLLSGSFITATVHLVLFVLVVKLFSVHRDRDRMYLAVISFLMLLSAAILTIDTFFLAAFISFALIAIVAFITMEMRRSMNASASIAPVRKREYRAGAERDAAGTRRERDGDGADRVHPVADTTAVLRAATGLGGTITAVCAAERVH